MILGLCAVLLGSTPPAWPDVESALRRAHAANAARLGEADGTPIRIGDRGYLAAERGVLFWLPKSGIAEVRGAPLDVWRARGGLRGCFGALKDRRSVETIDGRSRPAYVFDGGIITELGPRRATGSCHPFARLAAKDRRPASVRAMASPAKWGRSSRCRDTASIAPSRLEPMWENLAIGSVGYIAAVDLAREPIDFRRAGGTGPVVLVANALTMPADWMPSRSVNREIVLAADTVRITPPLERSRSSSGLARAVVIARAVQGADELSPALRIYQAAPKSKCSGPVRGFAEKAPVWCADDATRARPSLAGVLETAAQRFEAHVVPAELSPWEAAGFQQWARSWLGGQVARQSAWNDALAEKASETGIAQLGDASSSIIAYVFGETRSICPNPRVLLDVHPAGEGDRVRAPMMTVSTLAGARSFTIVQFSGRIVPDFDDADTVRKTLDLPPGWEVRCALDGAAKISAVVFDELQPASGSVNGDSVRVSVSAEDESILDRAYVRFASDAVQLEIDLPSKDVMWLGGIGFSSRYDARVQLAADRIMNSGLGTVAVEALAGVSGGKCLLRDGDGQMPEVAELTSAGVAARCRGPRWALDPRLMIYRDADPDAVAELAEGPAIRLFVVVNALQAIASDGVTHVTLAMKQGARSLPVISLLPGEARAVPLSGATVEPIEIAGVAYTISGAQALFRYVAEPATGTFYLDASVL